MSTRNASRRLTAVIPGRVPGIHAATSADGDARGPLDPGNDCRDDTGGFGGILILSPQTAGRTAP